MSRHARALGLVLLIVAGLFQTGPAACARVASVAPSTVCKDATAYPFSPDATVQVSTSDVEVGASIEVSGVRYCPNETITISIGGKVVGTAASGSTGSFDPPVVAPGPAGDKQVCAKGETDIPANDDCVTLSVRAVSGANDDSSSNGGGGTAITGTQVALLSALALLLIAGGVAFATAGRSRKDTAAAS